jgi:hypothetical protein
MKSRGGDRFFIVSVKLVPASRNSRMAKGAQSPSQRRSTRPTMLRLTMASSSPDAPLDGVSSVSAPSPSCPSSLLQLALPQTPRWSRCEPYTRILPNRPSRRPVQKLHPCLANACVHFGARKLTRQRVPGQCLLVFLTLCAHCWQAHPKRARSGDSCGRPRRLWLRSPP